MKKWLRKWLGVEDNWPYREIVSMCPYRGDALIAMADGSVYLVRDDLAADRPRFEKLTELRCGR